MSDRSFKLTPKQEAFALAYIESSDATEAYRRSYDVSPDAKPEGLWVDACKLLNSPPVALRVAELRRLNAERNSITVDKLTDMAERAYNLAMADDVQTPAAAVSATHLIAKLHGLIVDKSQNLNIVADFERILRARLSAAKGQQTE